jgi:small-conductance mechanosensitive channel
LRRDSNGNKEESCEEEKEKVTESRSQVSVNETTTRENSCDGCSNKNTLFICRTKERLRHPQKQPFQPVLTLTTHLVNPKYPLLKSIWSLHQEAIESPMLQANISRCLLALALVVAWSSLQSQTSPVDVSSSGDDIIRFLNQSVVWHGQLTAQQQLASEPSDVLFLRDNRQLADQIVRLSFDFARARAQALAGQPSSASPGTTPPSSSQYQRLAEFAAKADAQVKQSEQELDALRKKLATAPASKRRALSASIAETESELELFQARRDVARSLLQVSSTSGGNVGVAGLPAQIEELARTVPGVPGVEGSKEAGATANPPPASSPAPAAAAPQEHKTAPSGIIAVISDLFALRRKVDTLDDNLRSTDALQESAKELRSPLVAQIRELTQKGDQLAAQPTSNDPSTLAQQKKELDALTAQYKQLAASLLPLGKQSLLLDLYKRSVGNWRAAAQSQYSASLKGLLLRLGILGVILGFVLGIFELWRRATFRYVTDPRRRNQFLLLRRIALWCVLAIIISVAFASELGAITTFAGLLTIGITVALQNVILSVAGYFFLIGKYGVRVGDRVQVAGTTGDVVDVGVVRLHLMEVTGGASPRPTGRIAVFSNAVVFQAGAGLFKQIPGTNFLWHEITLTLRPDQNYRQIEQRLLDAVKKVYAGYQDTMERQRRSLERNLQTVQMGPFVPESRLRLTPSGLEVLIRYPVELSSAAETDDRVTRELLEAIAREPKLSLLGAQIEAKSA